MRAIAASGILTIDGRTHIWSGSKEPQPEHRPGHLTGFGAANCCVRYRDDPRIGLLRDVDPATNVALHNPDSTGIETFQCNDPNG